MNNSTPTPLHPVATTQAGELPELPKESETLHLLPGEPIQSRKRYTADQMTAYGIHCADAKIASYDIGSLQEQAAAWKAVFNALDEVTGCAWLDTGVSDMTTKELAVYAIHNLAAKAAAIEMQASHSAAADVVPVAYKLGSWFEARTLDEMQAFYMARLPAIREAARNHGYAIGLHGSTRRDFDLIAMQWGTNVSDKDTLAHAIAMAACGITRSCAYDWEQKPNGRVATSMPVCWTDHKNPEFEGMISLGHIDLSIVETTTAPASEKIVISEPVDRRVFVNQEEAAALNRFAETCEDSEGYDVPKPMMQRLACIGAIRRVTGNIYQFTDFGMWLMEPPTITATEPQ